jgi:hypothetical protein
MSDKEPKVIRNVIIHDSATVPTMQRAPHAGDLATNSAQIPTMQAAPQTTLQSEPSSKPATPPENSKTE